MTGPIAPKDPTEKRPGFYVLLDKQVGGMPQDDGSGRHPIYISPDRLPSFARVTGGVEDEEILELLTTAAGFRKLVYSVGVAVSARDKAMRVSFSINFRADCGSGSSHRFDLPCDGQEREIVLAKLEWSDGDIAPGEFLFELPAASDTASVTVKLYLNDGYSVPDIDPDRPVDLASAGYRELIARSFLSAGNNHRLKRFIDRARRGEAVTAAFIGGSITQGAGAVPLQERCYPRLTFEGLRERFGDNVRYIKAGVGGTPSETGLMRYDRDVTRDGAILPDLVVIEFAVNDAGDETEGVFYESLVRRVLSAPNEPAVILIFAVFANDWNLKSRLAPIGYRYELPMADVLEAVSPQFELTNGERVITKRQYFYDVYHPTNLGHRIMADCLLYLIDRADKQQPDPPVERPVPPYYGADYEKLRLLDRENIPDGASVHPGSFTDTDTALQCVPLDDDTVNTPMFPYNWKKGAGDEPFTLEIDCRRLALEFKDSADVSFGKARVKIDGELQRVFDPREAGWDHCHTAVLINRQSTARHKIEISMDPEDRDKTFTILGFGYVR